MRCWVSFIITIALFGVSSAFAQEEVFGVGSTDDVIPTSQPTTRTASTRSSRQKNPPGAIDKLVQIDTADKWSDGTLANANVHPDYPPRIELGYRESDFPRAGSWTGPET